MLRGEHLVLGGGTRQPRGSRQRQRRVVGRLGGAAQRLHRLVELGLAFEQGGRQDEGIDAVEVSQPFGPIDHFDLFLAPGDEGTAQRQYTRTLLFSSIVDLMKLVGMDSSLSARKQLATELHYSRDQSDTAAMNIWLHKEVLRKLSENGGKVPQELLS